MAESFITKLSSKVECFICHKILFKPRNLSCNHTFCQACLDEIIIFDKNGCGKLQCPMNECNGSASIGTTETVGLKLPVNYSLQHVLDMLKESKM